MTPHERLLVVIAALSHDVGHPGLSNPFFVFTGSKLALIYNDTSVLENFHAYATFELLKESGVYSRTHAAVFRSVRKHIIDLILSTDMAHHFSAVSAFRIRRESPEFGLVEEKDEDNRALLLRMCLKMADIGHATLDWKEHSEWCNRIMQEFYLQGDKEAKQNLTISPLCDRTKHHELPNSQVGFLDFLVLPLLLEINFVCPNDNVEVQLLNRANKNIKEWKRLSSEEKTKRNAPDPDSQQANSCGSEFSLSP